MKKTKTLSLTTFFFALFIFTGCNTYMGYDAIKSQEDIPGTKRDLKETALDYRVDIMKVAPEKMITNIIGKYEVERTKTVADFENREHVELKQSLNTAAAMFLFTPIKCIVDCFAVYTPWGLASNPPGFFTQLTYIPPFSWFAIFQSPPYYFKDYHDLKEGVNTYERTNKYGQKETVQSAIKYVSHEKVEVSRKQVFYKQIEERFITDAKQIAEARKFLQEKADSGNTEAQINLAKLYFYGIGGKANPELAISLLKKVESNGNCDTKELIKKYFTIPISDLEKAKTQQQKTTIQSNDKKTVKNTNKAIIRLQKKADDGDTQAMVSLALFYFRGRIVEHNPELAISLLKEAESKGNKSAAYFLKKYSSEVQTWEQQKKSSSALNTSSKKSNFPKNVSPAVKQQKNDYYCELFQFDPFDEKNFYNKLILQTAGRTMECQCGYSNKFYASVEAQATLLLNMRNPMNITEVKYLSSPSFPSSSDLQHECRWILQGSADKRTREKAYFIFSAYKIILEKTNFAITSDLSGGTGIIVDKKENNFIVLQVADGYSAKKAGIKENDQILAIGGENVSPAQSIGEIVSKLRGTPNTEVFVSIRQHLDGKIRTVSLKREPIVVMWTKKRFPFIEQQKIFSEDSKINCHKFADLWLKHIKPEVTTEKDLSFLWNYASFNEENNRILLSLCEKFNKYDWGWERRKDLLKEVAKTDNISIAEKLIKSGTDNLEVGNALQIALTNDSCKVAELLLLTYVPYNFNYASALKITAANKDSKCLPMILSRKKFSLEKLAYALDKAIKCNSTKNVRLILKYMDPLLKPEMSIGMNCAVPICKNNQEILSELTKRNIKISISSLADLIKFNSPKTIENVKFVIRDKKIWDLASPDMDSAMLASAETGNIGVLKLLIANGGGNKLRQ